MASGIREMNQELAQDFVSFKLGKGSPANTISPTARTLRRIASEVEVQHGDLFQNMIRTISCSSNDMSESYSQVVESMFADNVINWGRIAILFTFSGHLALYCSTHISQDEAERVVLWLTEFVNRKLMKWIQNNGGWDSFNKHFKERKDESSIGWGEYLAVGFMAGAAGALIFAR